MTPLVRVLIADDDPLFIDALEDRIAQDLVRTVLDAVT